jgi:hypothetical protein
MFNLESRNILKIPNLILRDLLEYVITNQICKKFLVIKESQQSRLRHTEALSYVKIQRPYTL